MSDEETASCSADWISSCCHRRHLTSLNESQTSVCLSAGRLNMALVSEFLGQLTLSYGGVSHLLTSQETGDRDNDSFSGWWCSDNYVSIKLIDLQHPDSDVCGRCSRFNLLQIILLCERIHSVGALQGFTAVIKQVQVWFCSPHRVHLILKTTRLINNPFRHSEQRRNRSCPNIRMTHFSWLLTLSK